MQIYEEWFPYIVILDSDDLPNAVQMYSWCKATFGKCIGNPDMVWCNNNSDGMIDFRFMNEADRNWFVLRWS